MVIVGADDAARVGNVHAFDKSTGRERWRFPAGHGVNSAIVGWGRRAYAATLQGELVSLDVESGEARWRLPLKVPTWESTAAVAGHVFAGTVDGSLYALNADTGKEEWRVSLGAPVTTSIDASESAVYVGAANGTIYRINPQSGAVQSSRKLDDQLRPRSSLVPTKNSLLVLLADAGADDRALVSVDPNLDKSTGDRRPRHAGTRAVYSCGATWPSSTRLPAKSWPTARPTVQESGHNRSPDRYARSEDRKTRFTWACAKDASTRCARQRRAT